MKLRNCMIYAALLCTVIDPLVLFADEPSIIITDPNQGHKVFKKLLNDKNLEGLVDIYAGDAVMVAVGGQEIRGRNALRAFFTETLKTVDNFSFETVFRMNYEDTVVFRSKYTVTFNAPDGSKITQSTGGIEVLRKQQDGTWLFVADHHFGGADYQQFLALNKPQ